MSLVAREIRPWRGVRRCAPVAGMCARRRRSFLCLAKEGNQRKATRMRRPAARGSLRCSGRGGGRRTRPLRGLGQLRPTAPRAATPAPLRSSAPHTGQTEPLRLAAHRLGRTAPVSPDPARAQRCAVAEARRSEPRVLLLPSPWAAARSAAGRGRGAQRRRVQTVRAPQGRVSALAPPREHRSAPLAPARGAGVGSPFFAYFPWRSKESRCAAGRTSRPQARSAARPARGDTRFGRPPDYPIGTSHEPRAATHRPGEPGLR